MPSDAQQAFPLMSRRGEQAAFIVAIVTTAALLLGAIELSGPHTRADFIALYGAGRIVLEGRGASLYEYAEQQRTQSGYTGYTTPLLYDHAPPEALLFVPLAHFDYPTAFGLWVCINLLLLGSCIFLLRRWFLQLSTWDELLLVAAALIPVLAAIWQGQDSILTLFLYAVVFRCLLKAQNIKAGAALALGIFKVQLVAPFLVLAAVRYGRRFLAGFLLAVAGLALVSAATVGTRTTLRYPGLLWSLNRKASLLTYHISPGLMPNLRGLAYATLSTRVPGTFLNLGLIAVSLLLILWALTRWRAKLAPDSDYFAVVFALDLLVTLLVSWHLLIHDLSLLLIPALLLLASTSAGPIAGSRWALLARCSLIVISFGEISGLTWLPRYFTGACVGLLLLLWCCASLPLPQRRPSV